MDNEKSAAEIDAERIIEDVYPSVRAELCPQGESCGVHFRVSETVTEEEAEYFRAIDYVGDYVVITDDNRLDGLEAMVNAVLTGSPLPGPWETLVFKVDSGTLSDLSSLSRAESLGALRYRATWDDWESLESQHASVVIAVREGFMDLSKAVQF